MLFKHLFGSIWVISGHFSVIFEDFQIFTAKTKKSYVKKKSENLDLKIASLEKITSAFLDIAPPS